LASEIFVGKVSQALEERIEALSGPGTKEAEERHARPGTVGAARAATDLASDHLAAARHTDPSQRTRTLRAVPDAMLDHLGQGFTTPCVIVLRISLLALLLFTSCWLDHVGFHKRWGRRLLLLQFLDAFGSRC